ncbi:MAG: hypothetical protein JNJ45_02025 [Chthonomonas sp.]|nr:hypothetical protein [Chthonomonas sp.]
MNDNEDIKSNLCDNKLFGCKVREDEDEDEDEDTLKSCMLKRDEHKRIGWPDEKLLVAYANNGEGTGGSEETPRHAPSSGIETA